MHTRHSPTSDPFSDHTPHSTKATAATATATAAPPKVLADAAAPLYGATVGLATAGTEDEPIAPATELEAAAAGLL